MELIWCSYWHTHHIFHFVTLYNSRCLSLSLVLSLSCLYSNGFLLSLSRFAFSQSLFSFGFFFFSLRLDFRCCHHRRRRRLRNSSFWFFEKEKETMISWHDVTISCWVRTEFQTAEQMYTSGNVNLNGHERAFLCLSMFPVSNETSARTELPVAIFPFLLLLLSNGTPIVDVLSFIKLFSLVLIDQKRRRRRTAKERNVCSTDSSILTTTVHDDAAADDEKKKWIRTTNLTMPRRAAVTSDENLNLSAQINACVCERAAWCDWKCVQRKPCHDKHILIHRVRVCLRNHKYTASWWWRWRWRWWCDSIIEGKRQRPPAGVHVKEPAWLSGKVLFNFFFNKLEEKAQRREKGKPKWIKHLSCWEQRITD